MTKDQEIAELKSQIGVQVKELILLSLAAYRHEQNCFELKAQVNAFIELQKRHYGDGMDTHLALIKLVEKTPQQCLVEYRNQVINECIEEVKLAILEGNGFYVARLEEMKNEQ